MEDKKILSQMPHQLSLTNRGLLGVEGVINLDSYDQERILMETNVGFLEIKGEGLHIQQLNLEHGKVVLDGDIVSLIYLDQNLTKKGKGFLGKLIK